MALVAINDAHVELLRLLARLEEASEDVLIEEAIARYVSARAEDAVRSAPDDPDAADLVDEVRRRLGAAAAVPELAGVA
jgi:hypothetical protein